MADRYWVGGTGNWSDTNRWSTGSGGGGGASVPTSADNVIFDDSSAAGTFTATVDATSNCADFTVSITNAARKMTLAGTAALNVYGSWSNPTATYYAATYSGTKTMLGTGTHTLTTNSITFGAGGVTTFSGTGTYTLATAISMSSNMTVTNGTFSTSASNYAMVVNQLSCSGTDARTVSLNGSSVSCNSSAPFTSVVWTTTGLTFNAGTSTITATAAAPTMNVTGITFYNLTCSSTALTTATINGANTYNNLTFTSRSAIGLVNVVFAGNQTVNGTLTFGAANTAVKRMFARSDTIGTARTLTVATLAALADVDFRDITAAGASASSNWSGTRLGNGGNNTSITFGAAKTVYWNLAGSQNWSADGWATTNNGVPATNNFPLAQDTATFTEAGAAGTVTFDFGWSVGTLQMADGVSNRTTAFTLATGASVISITGGVTLFASLTLSGTGQINLTGTSQTITSAGITFTQPLAVSGVGGTVTLADNFTSTSTGYNILYAGTLDFNGKTYSCPFYQVTGTVARGFTFGSAGKLAITATTSATIWSGATVTNFSYTGTSNIDLNGAAAAGVTRTIQHGSTAGGTESTALNFNVSAGAGTFTATSRLYANNLNFTGFTGTWTNNLASIYGSLTIASGMTVGSGTNTVSFSGTGAQTITSAGKTLDFPVTFIGIGGTVTLADNLNISARLMTLQAGTLSLAGNTLTCGTALCDGPTTRALNFGTNGTISVSGASWTASGSGFTTSGTGTITMTSASAKAFTGGGFSYKILNQGGAGALTVAGSNTFTDITNSYSATGATTITFTAGTTQTVGQFTASGASGNVLTLNSSSAGSQFTLSDSSGTNSVSYCDIKDSAATGGAIWESYLTNGNIDSGNNSGWLFAIPVVYSYSSDIKLRSLAQRGRF